METHKQTLSKTLISPAATVSGWVALVLSTYPWLWAKDASPLFKLDAWIYYHAVSQWHAGGSLYDWWTNPDQHLWPFTYPPFAAWVMTPLTWGNDRGTQVVLVLATPVCTAVTAWALLRALRISSRSAWAAAPWTAVGAVLVLEPVYKTMEYGQVNAVLMMLVALDLCVLPQDSRWRGVLSALAASFKLTPAIAVLVLMARREHRAAGRMVASATGVTALCWLVSPRESTEFFTSAMWDPSRAGFAEYSGNQNLKGAVTRGLPESLWSPGWALAVVLTVTGTWLVLRRLDSLRDLRDDDGTVLTLQLSVTMLLGLLVSPISWSHHWVWCVPALMALTAAGLRWHAPSLLTTALAGGAVLALAVQWWFPEQNHVEQQWPWWAALIGSSYTWWALATDVVLWCWAGRTVSASATSHGAVNHPVLPGTGSP